VLPTTAGPLPWLALLGFLSLLGGLGLTLRRWN
jgi:LPXTG-motif cell wall-anchored protein